ncbi:MAG: oligosaccharide flippase family protein [Candidatus Eisenbacteria bacterium]|nr:oligosaccharide flippase family protein [Candidatus Latescibacterota bacterium]MBD3301689.1 oligosaccharide flippase family protein [Candidatus Eisenbacteria bacterium]
MSVRTPADGYGGRLVTGTGSNLAATAVVFLCSFLLTPFLLEKLGDARYALFVLAQSIVGFSRLLTLGIPASLSRFLSEATARTDERSLIRSFTAGVLLLSVIGAVTALVILLLSAVFPRLFPVEEALAGPARAVLLILGLQVALQMPLLGFQISYQAVQKFHVPSLTRLVGAVVRTMAIFLVFSLGFVKLVLWALLFAATELLQGIYLAVRSRRMIPALRFRPRSVDRTDLRRLLGFSVWVFLGHLGFLLYYNTDYLLIHWFVGPEQVAHYNLAARWDPMLRTVVGSFAALLIPVSASLIAVRDLPEIRRLLDRATRYCLLVALPSCLLLAIFARPFLRAWAGEAYGEAAPAMVALLLPLVLTLSQTPSFSLFVGLGKAKVNGILTVAFAVVNVGLSLYFAVVLRLGLLGIALGTAVTYFVRTGLISPWYVCRITEQPLRPYVTRSILVPIGTALPMIGIAWFLRDRWAPDTLPEILGTMALASIAFIVPAWWTVLREADRAAIRSGMRRILRWS